MGGEGWQRRTNPKPLPEHQAISDSTAGRASASLPTPIHVRTGCNRQHIPVEPHMQLMTELPCPEGGIEEQCRLQRVKWEAQCRLHMVG